MIPTFLDTFLDVAKAFFTNVRAEFVPNDYTC